MSNIKIIVIVLIAVLIALGVSLTLFLGKNEEIVTPLNTEIAPSPTSVLQDVKFKEFVDSTGFKFSYPENLTIATPSAIDQNLYSLLKLTFNDAKGNIIIRAEDTKLKSIGEWLKENKISSSSVEMKNVKLADLDAKEVKNENVKTTVAFDQSVLFTITVDPQSNEPLWSAVYDKLISSFSFVAPPEKKSAPASSQPASSYEEDVILEGEEIVE